MKVFTNESWYNVETDQWEERFFVDGNIANEDLYFSEMERERDLEIEKLVEILELSEDEYNDECDCPICTINKYVKRIQEISEICPYCLEEILTDFMMDVVERIVIEDIEDDEIEREMKRFN